MNLIDNVIEEKELLKYSKSKVNDLDVNHKAKLLYRHQIGSEGFSTLKENLARLNSQKKTKIKVNSVPINLVLNPARSKSLKSTTFTKYTDTNEQKCILCNIPKDQKSVLIQDKKYAILANPGVSIQGDLTIPSTKHKKQMITGNFRDMLDIAQKLSDYSIYFNGAKAGASCPHLHFQAGREKRLIGEKQIFSLIKDTKINNIRVNKLQKENVTFYYLDNFLRQCYILCSKNREYLIRYFNLLMNQLKNINKNFVQTVNTPAFGDYFPALEQKEKEARINLMVNYEEKSNIYYTVIFPKRSNRPKSYYSDENKILLGMGIKESLGHLITCRRNDYNKLRHDHKKIINAFQDTSISKQESQELIKELSFHFNSKNSPEQF